MSGFDDFDLIAESVEHPAKHNKGVYGDLMRHKKTGVFILRVGGSMVGFPASDGERLRAAGVDGRMVTFIAHLEPTQKAWLFDEAARRGISAAEIVRELLAGAMAAERAAQTQTEVE